MCGCCDAVAKNDDSPSDVDPELQGHDCTKDSVESVEMREPAEIPSEEEVTQR